MEKKTFIIYMPVLHQGYMRLFSNLAPGDQVRIVSDEVAHLFDKRRKDIRAVEAVKIAFIVCGLFPKLAVDLFSGTENIRQMGVLHMVDEDISRLIADKFFPGEEIIWHSVFLRYDSKKSMSPQEVIPDRTVSRKDPVVAALVATLEKEASKSPDWWRQIAAGVVKDGKLLSLCYNKHVPSETITYEMGDPRSNATKGVATNISKAAHAEPLACFQAGKEACVGAELFVSTFPCPQCANFISFTRIKSLYFVEGYAMVDGADDLRRAGIEIVKVE